MFRKISFKIGILFFVFILVIEAFLFFILYTNLASDRVDDVMNRLLARGNTHRDVLEDHFDHPTLEHVGVMESASEFIVVITDQQGDIMISSDPVKDAMMDIVAHTTSNEISPEGEIVEDQWNEGAYIATDSPITIDGEHQGHVFMFANTDYVKRTVDQLGRQFLIAGLVAVVLTIAAIFILSRLIAQPLLKMKEATEQLSKGNHSVELHTDRKDELGDLANAISRLSKDLTDLKMARKEFLASISHELRTPLTYMKGYADVMSRPDTTDEEKEEYIGIIREETEQLNDLIQNLFELAKMDQNTFMIQPQPVVLGELIHALEELIGPAFAKKNITLTISCPEDGVAYVDPERFQQVLLNILDNARKHSYEGGTVALTVNQTHHTIDIDITDEGEGIPKADLPYIFDRLYRVEKSRSRLSGGSGLGLAIAREIIESHGGRLSVQSELDKGTRVTISLGRVDDDEEGAAGR